MMGATSVLFIEANNASGNERFDAIAQVIAECIG
jgi:hypothetical protein